MTENPYAPPPELPEAEKEKKPPWKQAKLAWILPIAGILIAIIGSSIWRDAPALGSMICWACLIGGGVYTILGFVFTRKYSNTLPHAISGCAILVIFMALMVFAIYIAISVIQNGHHH